MPWPLRMQRGQNALVRVSIDHVIGAASRVGNVDQGPGTRSPQGTRADCEQESDIGTPRLTDQRAQTQVERLPQESPPKFASRTAVRP